MRPFVTAKKAVEATSAAGKARWANSPGSTSGGAARGEVRADQGLAGQAQDHQCERDVDQEHHAPGRAAQVGVGQHPAEYRSAHGREAHHRADAAQGPGQLGAREHRLDQADGLGDDHRRRGSLQRPEGDQDPYSGRQGAGDGGEREARDARDEQPLAAEDVVEPPAPVTSSTANGRV